MPRYETAPAAKNRRQCTGQISNQESNGNFVSTDHAALDKWLVYCLLEAFRGRPQIVILTEKRHGCRFYDQS